MPPLTAHASLSSDVDMLELRAPTRSCRITSREIVLIGDTEARVQYLGEIPNLGRTYSLKLSEDGDVVAGKCNHSTNQRDPPAG